MAVLQVLSNPILPVFAIAVFGYLMGHTGRTSADDARLLNRFAMSVFLPIMIFGVVANAPVHRFSLTPVLVYAGVEAVIFAGAFALAYGLFKRDAAESVLLAFCGIFGNIVFFVLPVSLLLYGEDAVLPITTIVTLDSTITFAAALVALQIIKLGRITPISIVSSLARTPVLYAIGLGVLVSLLQIVLPESLQTFIRFNGAAAAPLALFALGVVLSGTVFRLNGAVITFTLIKLLVFPLVIAVGLTLFVTSDPGTNLYLLGAASPAGSLAFSLALLHDIKSDTIAQVIVWSSLLSLISLAILA